MPVHHLPLKSGFYSADSAQTLIDEKRKQLNAIHQKTTLASLTHDGVLPALVAQTYNTTQSHAFQVQESGEKLKTTVPQLSVKQRRLNKLER